VATSTEALHAKKRTVTGTRACRRLRAEGEVPGILYGHKEEVVPVQVSHDDLLALLRRHSRMVELHLGRTKEQVLLKAVQYDAFGSDLVHADFLRVALDEVITLEVPIRLKGSIKQEHAVLQRMLGNLEIECLPAQIPEEIVGQVAHMQIGDTLHVSDLAVPPGVKVLVPGETVVATVTPAKAEAVETAVAAEAAPAAAEPELIRREAKPGEEEAEEEKPKRGD
jgi:large subunit ribosomal protein L25